MLLRGDTRLKAVLDAVEGKTGVTRLSLMNDLNQRSPSFDAVGR